MKEKNKRKTNKFILIFRIISIITIIYCLIYIFLWCSENKKSANMLAQVTDSSILETVTLEVPNPDNENSENVENTQNTETTSSTKITTYKLDFNNLSSINKSTVGWITVPNTSVNYPVVQHSDNKFYLNHSFDKTYNKAGWIFADYRNKFDGTDKNIILYGHNRLDSSMFATLNNTQKKYWYTNPENKYITYTTPNGTNVYQIFSVYTIKSESYYLTTYFQNDDSYLQFLNTLKERSIHDFNVPLEDTTGILTLSTCDSSGKSRVVVHAKKVL